MEKKKKETRWKRKIIKRKGKRQSLNNKPQKLTIQNKLGLSLKPGI